MLYCLKGAKNPNQAKSSEYLCVSWLFAGLLLVFQKDHNLKREAPLFGEVKQLEASLALTEHKLHNWC